MQSAGRKSIAQITPAEAQNTRLRQFIVEYRENSRADIVIGRIHCLVDTHPIWLMQQKAGKSQALQLVALQFVVPIGLTIKLTRKMRESYPITGRSQFLVAKRRRGQGIDQRLPKSPSRHVGVLWQERHLFRNFDAARSGQPKASERAEERRQAHARLPCNQDTFTARDLDMGIAQPVRSGARHDLQVVKRNFALAHWDVVD